SVSDVWIPRHFFFYQLSGYLRALPSFPTRRSSDLFQYKAAEPLAVLLLPIVFEDSAAQPLAVLKPPPVLEKRASRPLAMLKSPRSEEHTSELQSHFDLVCRLLLEKKRFSTRGEHWQ